MRILRNLNFSIWKVAKLAKNSNKREFITNKRGSIGLKLIKELLLDVLYNILENYKIWLCEFGEISILEFENGQIRSLNFNKHISLCKESTMIIWINSLLIEKKNSKKLLSIHGAASMWDLRDLLNIEYNQFTVIHMNKTYFI